MSSTDLLPTGDGPDPENVTTGVAANDLIDADAAAFVPNGHVERDGWLLRETGYDADRAVAVGSNFMAGNGYLGYRATSAEQGAADYVALVVSDTYDCADGEWRELTTAPNPLFVRAETDKTPLALATADEVEWSLDLTVGETGIRFRHAVAGGHLEVDQRRFASYDDLHLLAQRWTLRYHAAVATTATTARPNHQTTATTDGAVDVGIDVGIDADVWSLNGAHLFDVVLTADDRHLAARGTTVESRVDIAVASSSAVTASDGTLVALGDAVVDGHRAVRHVSVRLAPGESIVIETVGAVASSNDPAAAALGGPSAQVTAVVDRGAAKGYDELRRASTVHWDAIWHASDVRIEGSELDDAALRFCVYHNRICTPVHADHLPIGARGLSCQAYQGAAFWDQEVYNLPAFLFTAPDVARSIIVYRHLTLDGARRKAQRLGYNGAYYAWISGTTGDELCPDYFFVDVLTGRPIRNHFNVWQMHVSPDIVTMVERYVDVTGDIGLLVDHGAEIAFEVARFLHSFVRYDEWREVYHCIRLLGPDEWHENVDDNAFTNYQVRAALRFAIDTYERLERDHPDDLARIAEAIGLDAVELEGWRRVHDRIFLPEPGEDGLIEQFAGFFELEDVTPAVVRTRLLHPQEYWGWPNGVAVRHPGVQAGRRRDAAVAPRRSLRQRHDPPQLRVLRGAVRPRLVAQPRRARHRGGAPRRCRRSAPALPRDGTGRSRQHPARRRRRDVHRRHPHRSVWRHLPAGGRRAGRVGRARQSDHDRSGAPTRLDLAALPRHVARQPPGRHRAPHRRRHACDHRRCVGPQRRSGAGVDPRRRRRGRPRRDDHRLSSALSGPFSRRSASVGDANAEQNRRRWSGPIPWFVLSSACVGERRQRRTEPADGTVVRRRRGCRALQRGCSNRAPRT